MARSAIDLITGKAIKKNPRQKLLDWFKPVSIAFLWIFINFILLVAFSMDYNPQGIS